MTRRWTPKGAVNRSRRNIAGAIERMRAIALEWGDVDQGIVDQAEQRIRDLEEWSEEIAAYIKDRLAAGEHVGL